MGKEGRGGKKRGGGWEIVNRERRKGRRINKGIEWEDWKE